VRAAATRLGALAAALLAGAVLAEILLRLSGLAPGEAVAFVSAADADRIPGIHAPGQDLVLRVIPTLPHRVHIDSLGFRGPELARVPAAGETRVFLTGDSFGFGAHVDDDSTLAAFLQRDLREECDDVRVVNGSLGGSTITDQAHLVERALAVHPALVVLEITGNDVADLLTTPPLWDQLAADRARKARTPLAWVYPALRRTALWRVARAGLSGLRARRRAARLAAGTPRADSLTARLREEYRVRFYELRDQLARADVALAAIVYPDHASLGNAASDYAWCVGLLGESGVPFVDAGPPLLATALPDSALWLVPDDAHPRPRGYAIAARAAADLLRDVPPLDAACRARRRGAS